MDPLRDGTQLRLQFLYQWTCNHHTNFRDTLLMEKSQRKNLYIINKMFLVNNKGIYPHFYL